MIDAVFNYLIKSPYVKAQILAQVRHLVTAVGSAMLMHGLADKGMTESLAGFVMAAAGFYLANLDVKMVDGKIKVALLTPAPAQEVEVKNLPDIPK